MSFLEGLTVVTWLRWQLQSPAAGVRIPALPLPSWEADAQLSYPSRKMGMMTE